MEQGQLARRRLIEKHQGEIALTSEVGSFTEVVVRIPCADAKASSGVTGGNAMVALKKNVSRENSTE
jgi:two-component system OmpR family sensor kinase